MPDLEVRRVVHLPAQPGHDAQFLGFRHDLEGGGVAPVGLPGGVERNEIPRQAGLKAGSFVGAVAGGDQSPSGGAVHPGGGAPLREQAGPCRCPRANSDPWYWHRGASAPAGRQWQAARQASTPAVPYLRGRRKVCDVARVDHSATATDDADGPAR